MKLIPTSVNPVTITLYRNYPFDNSYRDTTLFSRKFKYLNTEVSGDSDSFLDIKNTSNHFIFPRTTKTGTYNFAFGNGLVTSVMLELTGDEINTNYIKVECSVTHEVYYYFVTQILQKNESTYLVSLELDIFMTYGDEFLDSMYQKPVMVERKHCYRVSSAGRPYCTDLIKGDSNFTGVKANISESVKKLELDVKDKNNVRLKNYNWCYVIMKIDSTTSDYAYKENNILHSYVVLCFPMVELKFYKLVNNTNTLIVTYNPNDLMKFWANNERTYKISILPYPPFNNLGTNEIISQNDTLLEILMDNNNLSQHGTSYDAIMDSGSKTKLELHEVTATLPSLVVLEGFGGGINYQQVSLFTGYTDLTGGTMPSITDGRNKYEFKMYLPPFKEFKLRTFADDGANFSPQLRLNKGYGALENWDLYNPKTIVSTNPDNTSYFTSMVVQEKDIENKNGLGTNYYYSMPTSYTALQHFLNTASAEYNNSKLINGLSAIANIGLGGAMVSKGGTMGTMAGAGAIMNGFIKEVNNITSYYAKMEDLKNTPSSLTTGGSTFTLDYAMALSTSMYMTPFVSVYSVDKSILECASDFFYKYGYEVNRECYFNQDVGQSSGGATDTSIFTRTLFNYVKLSEDITDKIIGVKLMDINYGSTSGVPYVVAKKFAEVFMNGVTIWNFFGFNSIKQKKIVPLSTSDVFVYFQKCNRCNAEYYGQSY